MTHIKKLTLFGCICLLMSSCDPVATMTANIKNNSSETLTIVFPSTDSIHHIELSLSPNETKLFQDGMDIGSTYLEPRLGDYDSVYILNAQVELVKVYKANSPNKNIYNVPEDWQSSEPSRWVFEYLYEIENSDIE